MSATTKKITQSDRLDRLEAMLENLVGTLGGIPVVTTEPVIVGSPDVIEVSPTTGAVLGTKTAQKIGNHALADFLREIQVVPQGSAWTLAKAGERDQDTLQLANLEDGLDFEAYAEVGEKIRSGIAARVEASATAKTTTKSTKKSAAAKKAVAGRARDEKGRLLPKGTKAAAASSEPSKVDLLIAAGFTRTEALKHVASLV